LLLFGLAALALALVVQRHVEQRRVETNLVWTDPENKQALEAGFMALGGFRGVLADVLWVRAISQQDAGRYYELKMICEMIQRLQPTFTKIHSFQAHNMAYNLAANAGSCDDKWYWIHSGMEVLEKGLERNRHYYGIWFDLGFFYMDRLDDTKLIDRISGQDCRAQRDADLPMLDDLDDAQRQKVFTHPELWKGRARPSRPDEHLRFAAYFYFKSLETHTNANPLRVERTFGNCLDRLGHFRSKEDVAPENRKWDEWGSEDWWVEMIRRNKARGLPNEKTAPENLKFTMLKQIGLADTRLQTAMAARNEDAARALQHEIRDTYKRYHSYFPDDPRTLVDMVKEYRKALETNPRFRR
jgi:hypothetical protein